MRSLWEIGIRFGERYPFIGGLLTILAVAAFGLLAFARAIELGKTAGLAALLVGGLLGLWVISIWVNAGRRRDYKLNRTEWIITLAGQAASVVAVFSLLTPAGPVWWQAASASYLSAFLLGLTPGLVVGWRRTLRDPKSARMRVAHAADALLGRRRRR
jgi:hypothetical protein